MVPFGVNLASVKCRLQAESMELNMPVVYADCGFEDDCCYLLECILSCQDGKKNPPVYIRLKPNVNKMKLYKSKDTVTQSL